MIVLEGRRLEVAYVGATGKEAYFRLSESLQGREADILRSALSTDDPRPRNLAHAIHERFGSLGGVDLPEVPREAIRQPVDFG